MYLTVAILFAGIAVACEGGGIPQCTEKPGATTTAASGVTYNSAYLEGDVDPHGCETTYWFEWRKKGETEWKEGIHLHAAGNEPVLEWRSGLEQLTPYEFRLSANDVEGTTPGKIETFTTPAKPQEKPTVNTEAATGITSAGATLNGSVNPNGAATTYKFEYGTKKEVFTMSTPTVSAGSEKTSKKVHAEVGLEPGTVYYFRISATNSGGTSPGNEQNFTTSSGLWKIQKSPNPEGASDTDLYDISCEPSTSLCTSVGTSTASGVDSPVAQRWNGSTWSEQAAAKKSGATHTRLFGVDCPSETRCLAVGNYQSSGTPSVLSELWNEGKWNVQTTPIPAEATSSEFEAIGCNSTANCTAVGSAVIGGVKTAIAERWTSPTWAQSSIPIPEGAKSSQLDGVDCIWSNFCAAVGRYTTSGGSIKSLVEFWNGTNWSLQTATDPEGASESALLDVACTPTPNRCTAVGDWKNSAKEQVTLAYRFNGVTTWTLQSTPNPPGSTTSILQDVSCATETSCTAAGSRLSSLGGSNMTLAEAWDGSSWSIQGTPNPAGATFSAFLGASCRGTACLGVGWSTNGSGVDTSLAEIRE